MAVVPVRVYVAEHELSARLDLTVPGRLEVAPGDPVIALTVAVEVVVRLDQALIEPRSIVAAIEAYGPGHLVDCGPADPPAGALVGRGYSEHALDLQSFAWLFTFPGRFGGDTRDQAAH